MSVDDLDLLNDFNKKAMLIVYDVVVNWWLLDYERAEKALK